MFLGRLSYSVDVKGRLSVPAEFRTVLAQQYGTEEVWVAPWMEINETTHQSARILHAYPRSRWDEITAKLSGASSYDPELLEFRRQFLSGATQCFPDKQGRIALTTQQRGHAGIENEVMFVGAGVPYIEIWDLATFDRWQEQHEHAAFAGIGRRLKELAL
jgi:MraZ protein